MDNLQSKLKTASIVAGTTPTSSSTKRTTRSSSSKHSGSELINLRFDENRKRQGLILTLLSTNVTSKKVVTNYTTPATTQYNTLEHPRNVDADVATKPAAAEGENTSSSSSSCTLSSPTQLLAISSEQVDKSRKGSVDEKILPLVNLINSTDDFFTTSTCSGRIILFANVSQQSTTTTITTFCSCS